MASNDGDKGLKKADGPNQSDKAKDRPEETRHVESTRKQEITLLEFLRKNGVSDSAGEANKGSQEDYEDETDSDRAITLLLRAEKESDLGARSKMIREAMMLDPNLVTHCPADFKEAITDLEKEDRLAILADVFRNLTECPMLLFAQDPSTLFVNGAITGEEAPQVLEIIKTEMPDCPLKQEYLSRLPRIIALREEGLDFDTRSATLKMPIGFRSHQKYKACDPKRYSTLSDELYEVGEIEESHRFLYLAVRMGPKNGRRQVRLLASLIQAGDFEAALKVLQPEAKFDPEEMAAVFSMIASLGDDESNKSEGAYRLQMTLMRQVLDYEGAEHLRGMRPLLDAVLASQEPTGEKVDETSGDSLWAHAVCLQNSGNYAGAIECMLKVKELTAENSDLLAYLGRLYSQNRQHSEALAPLKRAIEISPNNPVYRDFLGSALQLLGRHEEALEQFEAAENGSEDAVHCASMACSLMQLNRYEEADKKIEKARELSPDTAYYIVIQAVIAGSSGHQDEAYSLAEEALRKANGDIRTLDVLASIFNVLGEHERALKIIEQAITLKPKNEELLKTFDLISRRVPLSATDVIAKLRN
jgi:tetratricopeptide (TPR) repeat protein